jgi:predicted permease
MGIDMRAERRRGLGLDRWIQDVRFGWRAAVRRPAPYLLALVTYALGIGTSVAMYSVVDGVLLRPLPYPDAARIVSVYPTIPAWRGHPSLNASWDRASFSQPEFFEWGAAQTSFVQAAALSRGRAIITSDGAPERISVSSATADLFPMLGASAVIGRLFTEEDGARGAPDVVVISDGFWMSRFGGSRDIVGRNIRMDGNERTVIGVLQDGFTVQGHDAAAWIPIDPVADDTQREDHSLTVVARLREGVPLERAEQETDAILRGLSEKHPEQTRQMGETIERSRLMHGGNLVAWREDLTREVRTPLLILLAAAMLLLAVACTNVSALVLGIGIDREQELVVRGAIGADRRRLIRQLLTESLGLAVVGGVGGVLVALALTRGLVRLAPADVPRLADVSVDARVTIVALAVSAVVGIVFGLAPALSLTRADLSARLRTARVAGLRSRLHGSLVVLQLSMATLLLVGAGLLTRTLFALDAVDPGFDPDGLLTVTISPVYQQFASDSGFDGRGYDQYFDRFAAGLGSIPGVRAVAIGSNLPYSGSRSNNEIEIEGYTSAPGEVVLGERYWVSANFMDVLGMSILEGRAFTEADDRAGASKVTIISERFARRYFPGQSPIGRWIKAWFGTLTIVGVVADARDRSLAGDDHARYYMPRRELGGQGGSFVLDVGRADPDAFADAVRARIWAVDPDVPVLSVRSLRDTIHASLAEQRFRARLMLVFAVLAALFAVLGIYGVTSRSAASRTREMGIRVALGAGKSGVMGLIIRQGLTLAASGVLLGVLAATGAARVLASFLYGVEPLDPLTLLLVAAALAGFAGLASLGPSLRASRVQPIEALKAE